MKKTAVLFILIALIFSACAPASAEPTITEAMATQPTEVPTTAATQPEILDYETYFSSLDPVEPVDDGYGNLVLSNAPINDVPEEFAVEAAGEESRLTRQTDEGQEVLFTDPYGVLNEVQYHNRCLFFLAGIDAETNGIYRLYLPEGKVDVLVEDIPVGSGEDGYRFSYFKVVSNCELTWVCAYPALEAHGAEYWNQPVLQDGQTPHEMFHGLYPQVESYEDLLENKTAAWQYAQTLCGVLRERTGRYTEELYYRNTMTEETRSCFSDAVYSSQMPIVYPDGTARPEEERQNGDFWWLDSYYTGENHGE